MLLQIKFFLILPSVWCRLQLLKLGKRLLGPTLFHAFMKQTFYGHFVAGQDEKEILPVIRHMHSFGVKSILDYSAEEDLSEQQALEAEMR
ncbi:proline dehydrogenase 1, mitochondrial [Trichonephila clavata]|uniref:Proline dehydrogenase n=1 Tax=Trichonephila clavata TaxID=2740835 RepID=A0A8X6KVK4_TRICU|nr:proline dehydrogenase 1, mitochondrial [Trichonephila clavata]